eukprot:15467330-Alexandrium_andersonii.AAC.1
MPAPPASPAEVDSSSWLQSRGGWGRGGGVAVGQLPGICIGWQGRTPCSDMQCDECQPARCTTMRLA